MQVHLGFPGGGMALIDYDGRPATGHSYHSLSVIAAHGAAYADDHQNMQLVYDARGVRAVRTDECAARYAAIAQEFVDDLRSARQNTADIANWKTVFEVAAALRQSLATGQAVPLEDR